MNDLDKIIIALQKVSQTNEVMSKNIGEIVGTLQEFQKVIIALDMRLTELEKKK